MKMNFFLLNVISQNYLLYGLVLHEVLQQALAFRLSERGHQFYSQALQRKSVRLPHRVKRSLCLNFTCKDNEYCDPFDKYCRSCALLCQGTGMVKGDSEKTRCEELCPEYYLVLQSITTAVTANPTSPPGALETRDTSSAGKLHHVANIFIVVFLPLIAVAMLTILGFKARKCYVDRKQCENTCSNNTDQEPIRPINDGNVGPGTEVRAPAPEANVPGPSNLQRINGATGVARTRNTRPSHENHKGEEQSRINASNGNLHVAQGLAGPSTSTSSGSRDTVLYDSDPSRRIRFPVTEDESGVHLFEATGHSSIGSRGIEMKNLHGCAEREALLRGDNSSMDKAV